MEPLSKNLIGFDSANPFFEAQSRNYGLDKVVNEFYPTTFYWSLFNETHEILLGTRGSGKTIILKMLTYSYLRKLDDPKAKQIVKDKKFIGFYVPLHLEFMAAIPGINIDIKDEKEYFQFAFNCAAVKSFLNEIEYLLEDATFTDDERMTIHFEIVKCLNQIWFPNNTSEIGSLKDLKWKIELLFYKEGEKLRNNEDINAFMKPILTPIVSVLEKISELLNLDSKNINWIVCIDEAEFLKPQFIECINTFFRSDKKRITIKMATMPFKHSTLKTNLPNVEIEPEGNDFNYRLLDLKWDSLDFKGLTDSLCAKRLSKCLSASLKEKEITLENFLGVCGNDDFIDFFRQNVDAEEATEEAITKAIISAMSEKRRQSYVKSKSEGRLIRKPYYDRFAPVYFTRIMRAEDKRGNRTVGWFAGAKNVRRVADGNPRRFIQIMNDIVEEARKHELTFKRQHRVIVAFCKKSYEHTEALPEFGYLVIRLIDLIGEKLSKRVHGKEIFDAGCSFNIDKSFTENILLKSTIEDSIAYSLIISDENTLYQKLSEHSQLRLSFLYCVQYWLPMRKGHPIIISSKEKELNFSSNIAVPTTATEADQIFQQYEIFSQESAEENDQ